MEYLIGAVVVGLAFYILFIKREVNRFNKLCLLDFPAWMSIYTSSEQPEKSGIARAFLLQSLHLSEQTGALAGSLRRELEVALKKEDPVKTVDEWLKRASPDILAVCGESNLSEIDARQMGVFVLLCLGDVVNPRESLKRYIQRYA